MLSSLLCFFSYYNHFLVLIQTKESLLLLLLFYPFSLSYNNYLLLSLFIYWIVIIIYSLKTIKIIRVKVGFGLDESDPSQILSQPHAINPYMADPLPPPPLRDSYLLTKEITTTHHASSYNNGFNHHTRSIHVGRAVQINPPINQSIKI